MNGNELDDIQKAIDIAAEANAQLSEDGLLDSVREIQYLREMVSPPQEAEVEFPIDPKYEWMGETSGRLEMLSDQLDSLAAQQK